MYSSAQDMTKFGRAIMASTLVPMAVTRRWLKPVAFTSDPQAGMGAPWGIRRINVAGHPYRWVFAFQKAGTIGDYSALMILLPEYDVGLTVLMAGDIPGNFNFDCADAVGTALLPALDAAAKAEAEASFGGRYVSGSAAVNSSMTIVADDRPGLGVTSWISNGTDMALVATLLQLHSPGPVNPSVRLYPTMLETTRADGTRAASFKAVFEDKDGPPRAGRMFSTDCATWLSQNQNVYGRKPVDEFVFEFDAQGKVVSVEPIAFRLPLKKV